MFLRRCIDNHLGLLRRVGLWLCVELSEERAAFIITSPDE
jgi:hypothetical protein